jgi:predicted DNA-binding transcriptional regulator YafY
MHQFLHFQEGDRLRKGELTDEFGVDNKTIQRDMMFFDTFRLIKPGRQSGYIPEPKFFRLVNRLDRIDPQKYNFDRPYREVYGEGA